MADIKTNYIVVIIDKGEVARLPCSTLAEAQNLKRAYLNWGGYEQVTIEQAKPLNDRLPTDWVI
jgi:hypothetical protein